MEKSLYLLKPLTAAAYTVEELTQFHFNAIYHKHAEVYRIVWDTNSPTRFVPYFQKGVADTYADVTESEPPKYIIKWEDIPPAVKEYAPY